MLQPAEVAAALQVAFQAWTLLSDYDALLALLFPQA
jgi:hypothetical protein